MKKHLFIAGAALLLLASCSKEPVDTIRESESPVFYATIESADNTRVYADQDLRVLWNEDDRISIFNKYSLNEEYVFDGETGDNAGNFYAVPPPTGSFATGNDLRYIYAVYPYESTNRVTNQEVVRVRFRDVQDYAEKTFGLGANPMVSVSDDYKLLFRNVGGYLMVKLYGETYVKSVTITGNNNEKIAGYADVTMRPGEYPESTMQSTATTSVTVDCGDGILVGANPEDYTEFWFVLPEVTFHNGFTMTVTDIYGNTFTKTTNRGLQIWRNWVEKMAPVHIDIQHGDTDNIVFADPAVKALLVAAFDTNTDNEISFGEAAAVTSSDMEGFFKNKSIHTFDEFRFFTGMDTVPFECFSGCSNLESLTFPSHATTIVSNAFDGCSSLQTVDIPANINVIQEHAFDTSGLEEAILRATGAVTLGVTSFPDFTYNGSGTVVHTGLRKLTLYTPTHPEVSIPIYSRPGIRLFNTEIYIPAAGLSDYMDYWFPFEGNFRLIPETLDEIIAFEDYGVKSVLVNAFDRNGDGYLSYREALGVYDEMFQCISFEGNTAIRSFDELKYFMSLETIPDNMFKNCTNLASVSIPYSVCNLGASAFEGCALRSLRTSFTLGWFGYRAFANCTSLETISLRGLGSHFEGQPFNGCTSLTTLKIFDQHPESMSAANGNFELPATCAICVPYYWDSYTGNIYITRYQTAWPDYANQIIAMDADEWWYYDDSYLPK